MNRRHALASGLITAYLFLFSELIYRRVVASWSLWQTDFAIFRQTGTLLRHGKLGQVYRYVPVNPDPTQYGPVWHPYLHHVDGYYYAQTPWQAIGMIPFSVLSIQDGYILYTLIMLAAIVGTAGILYRETRTYYWPAILLAVLFAAPFVTSETWGQPDYTLNIVYLTGPLRFESILGVTLWYGQYTPLILFMLTLGFSYAQRGQNTYAGLLLVLATMKPNVLFGIPLVLMIAKDRVTLIRKTAGWGLLFLFTFASIPALGFPIQFTDLVLSYTDVFWPIFLQAHNYVWMYGILITTVALYANTIGPNE